jgi:zinc protease
MTKQFPAVVVLACAQLVSGCSIAGLRRQPDEWSRPLPVDTQVVTGVLDNGLKYYIRANREPESRAELRLAVDAGSVLEDPDQLGLAHVLEHMAFNGTSRFARNDLVDYLESVGMRFGPDINAYTSYDETVYTLTLPTDSAGVLETGFEILEDWAHGITLDPAEIDRERGVVIEEWRLAQSAAARMQREQLPVLMRRSRYARRDPIGTFESLTTFTHEALRRFYRDWYRPDLMAVVAVGDFDVARVEALIRERFGAIPPAESPRRRRAFDVPAHDETLVSVATDPEATSTSVSLYLKRRPEKWTTIGSVRQWLIESLASSMLTNRLSERTQRPDSPFLDVSSFHGRFIRPLSAHVLNVRVPEGGVSRGLEALLREAERAARHGFTATELEREKREMMRYVERRHAEREKTTSSSFAAEYVSHFLYGGTPMDVSDEYRLHQELLPGITVEDVNASAVPWMEAGDRVVLVRARAREGTSVPDEAELARVAVAVESDPLRPYTDSLSAAPLVPDAPEPGRVVAETVHPGVGVTEWVLSNGARVLLKPTDHREEEILFAGRSPGGTSLVPDEDYVAALTATAVVQAGGLGELSGTELRKRLAGTVAGVGADIGEYEEWVSGAASPRDLETMFQLTYLKFTSPRKDTTAFLAYQQQARAALENRSASPESEFSDTLRVTLAQHHPRVRPPGPALFDSLDLHRSLEIYRERFGDASDFTFYLVGRFDPDSVRPLVERYLASLPSLHREEEWRDLGIRPPRGVVKRVVRRGLENKGITQLVFTGAMAYDPEALHLLRSLGDLLRIRLREELREELSGTYGVSVRTSGSSRPVPQYQLSIAFGSAPDRIDELTAVIFDELRALQGRGPTEHDVAKVREMQLRAREVDARTNQFWISQILAHDQNDWPLREIAAGPRRIAALAPAGLREAARRYVDPTNYVQVTLVPEESPAPGVETRRSPEPRR